MLKRGKTKLKLFYLYELGIIEINLINLKSKNRYNDIKKEILLLNKLIS